MWELKISLSDLVQNESYIFNFTLLDNKRKIKKEGGEVLQTKVKLKLKLLLSVVSGKSRINVKHE